jgi:hypothetical protein
MAEYFLSISTNDFIGNICTLNNAQLILSEDDGNETMVIRKFLQPTKKGWASTKKIVESIEILETEDGGCVISEESAKHLIKKYGNVKVKTFDKNREFYHIPASNEIAKFMGPHTDPYDVG